MIRTVLSFLLGLCAVVLVIGGVAATAVDRTVVDRDGFVRFASPLGQDTGLQHRAVDTVTGELKSRLQLPAAIEDAAATLIDRAAGELASDARFPSAWDQSLQRTHDQTMDTITSADQQSRIQLDIAPLARLVADKVAGDLGSAVIDDSPILIDLGLQQQAQSIGLVVRAVSWAQPALIASAVAALLALLLAHRRTTTLALLGAGVLVGTGALWAGLQLVLARVQGDSDAAALGDYARYRLVDLAAGAAVPWLSGLAIGGAVLLVVGLLGRAIAGSAHR